MTARWQKRLSAILVFSLLFSFVPNLARAEGESLNLTGKRMKIVGKAAAYGAGGGLIIGLASQVWNRRVKNIFMFTSLGLYAGILLGVIVVATSRGPTPYEGPDTYEDYGDFSRARVVPRDSLLLADNKPAPALQVNLVKFEF